MGISFGASSDDQRVMAVRNFEDALYSSVTRIFGHSRQRIHPHTVSGLLCNAEDHRKQNDKLQYREDSSDINEDMKDRSPR